MNFSNAALVLTDNVALGEDAVQSGVYRGRVATLALDGDFETAACTTMASEKPWWAVDLGWGVNIDRVVVTNEKYLNYGELIVMTKYVSPLSLANLYSTVTKSFAAFCILLQRINIACYAERCTSYDKFRLSVRLSVTFPTTKVLFSFRPLLSLIPSRSFYWSIWYAMYFFVFFCFILSVFVLCSVSYDEQTDVLTTTAVMVTLDRIASAPFRLSPVRLILALTLFLTLNIR